MICSLAVNLAGHKAIFFTEILGAPSLRKGQLAQFLFVDNALCRIQVNGSTDSTLKTILKMLPHKKALKKA